MKKIRNILLAFIFVPIIIVAVVCSLPFILLMRIDEIIKLRIFCRRESGNVYLICTSKRSWHEFLNNNLIPILPDNFRVVWVKPNRDGVHDEIIKHLDRARIYGIAKPYLIFVTKNSLHPYSLNLELQKLKSHQKNLMLYAKPV